jgi:hypothetical protein
LLLLTESDVTGIVMVEDEALLDEGIPEDGSGCSTLILLLPDLGRSFASQTSSLGSSSSHWCDKANRPDTSCDAVPDDILKANFVSRKTCRQVHINATGGWNWLAFNFLLVILFTVLKPLARII